MVFRLVLAGFDCVPPLLLEDDVLFLPLLLPLLLAHVDSVFRRNTRSRLTRASSHNLPIMALKGSVSKVNIIKTITYYKKKH